MVINMQIESILVFGQAIQNTTVNPTYNVWDAISVLVSIAAIIVAVGVAVMQHTSSKKDKQVALEAEYFRTIYSEHLLRNIPSARQEIIFDSSHHLSGCNTLLDELNSIRRDSAYFQYQDPSFYASLKTQLQNLENYITEALNKMHVGEDQTSFNNRVCDGLTVIYKTISKRYYGEKT